MRFFITFFCFVLIACFANITQAEPAMPAIEKEDTEWKQIESELNADWDVDIKDIETSEDAETQDKKEEPEKEESSKIWPFAAGYLLGKVYK